MFKSLDAFLYRSGDKLCTAYAGGWARKLCPSAQVVGKIVRHLELLADPPRMVLDPGEVSSKP
jgi:hypothetical protein